MNRSKQSEKRDNIDMFRFSCIRVKRITEREQKRVTRRK